MKTGSGALIVFAAACLLMTMNADAQLPDLTVLSVSSSSSAGTGQMLGLTNTMANIGAGSAANWHYAVYLSGDATITTGDTLLATSPLYANIPPGVTNVFVDYVTVPSAISTGAYYFGAIVDYDSTIVESVETNNAKASGLVNIGYGPDLTVLSTTGPRISSPGQTVILTNTLANIGIGAAYNWQYRVYLSTNTVITTNRVLLASSPVYSVFSAGASNTFADSVVIPPNTATGSYYFGVIVDHNNLIAEAVETNNSSSSLSVNIGPGPDLTVISVRGPSAVATGQAALLTNKVANIGIVDAGAWHYRVYLSPDASITTNDTVLASSILFTSLAAGTTNSYVDPVTIPPGIATGLYYFGVVADYDNTIQEAVETNNSLASAAVNVGIGADLSVLAVRAPASAGTGQTIGLTNTLANIGVGSAGTWRYGIYLATNSTITTNGVFISSSAYFSSISPGTTNTYVDSILIPPNAATGIYYLGIIADYENLVPELVETNNALSSAPINIGPGPDLTVLSVFGLGSVGAGQTLTLTNTMANIGLGSAGNWRYAVYLSTNAAITTNAALLSSSVGMSGFLSGATNTYFDIVTIPPATASGTYYFGVIADVDGQVVETIETNNARASAAVSVGPGPDLTVVSVGGPSGAGTAQSVQLTNVIANIGVGSSGSWRYGIYLSTNLSASTNGTLLATSPFLGGIVAGVTNTYIDNVTIPATAATGTYYFGVVADFDNLVTEMVETNNARASSPVAISIGPDLSALSVQSASSAGIGQILVVTGKIANVGSGSASNWHYRVYLSPDVSITTNDVVLSTSPLYSSFAAGISNLYLDTVTIPTNTVVGSYYFGLIVDYDGTLTERTKTNNSIASAPVSIVYGVDLVALSVRGPSSATPAQSVWLTNTLANNGIASAGNWRYRTYFSSNSIASTNGTILFTSPGYASFSPSATNVFTDQVSIPGGISPGIYYFTVVADFDNAVAESNESNNSQVSGPLFIGPIISALTAGTNSVILRIEGLSAAQQCSISYRSSLFPDGPWTTGYVFTAAGVTNWTDGLLPSVTSRVYRVSQP